jgi:hypothetical protein
MEKSLHGLSRLGLRLGRLRPDIAVFLFNSAVLSMALYALALVEKSSPLDDFQAEFAKKFLGLPPQASNKAAKGELGLYDFDLQVAKAKLLLLHRVVDNPDDPITPELTKWKLDSHGSTFRDRCSEALATIGSSLPLPSFLRVPYPQAKGILEVAIAATQQSRWVAEWEDPELDGVSLSKPKWGFSSILTAGTNSQARQAYIAFRLGAMTQRARTADFPPRCILCAAPQPGFDHLLWECDLTAHLRIAYMDLVRKSFPLAHETLRNMERSEVSHTLLGALDGPVIQSEKRGLQAATADLILNITEKIAQEEKRDR